VNLADLLQLIEVGGIVNELELVPSGVARLERNERVDDRGMVGANDHGIEPLRTFRMVRRGHVIQVTRVRCEEEGHLPNATVMGVVRFVRRFSVPDVVLRAGGSAIRVRPWPGDDATAQVLPVPGALLPSASEVARWLHGLSRLGYHRVRTAALGPQDQGPYREAGLDPLEELALLRRPLDASIPAAARRLHRVGSREWAALPSIDAAAFPAGWQLDHDAILDACRATPRHRLRVATDEFAVGYVVHGRAGTTGYVQRLAVLPAAEGRGWGTALVLDGLNWMRSHACTEVLVNTHVGNERALALYERLGFHRLPEGLIVLGRTLVQS
jgi:ribosomal protein S18 acetylase RimI-like enzyme